MKWCVRRLLLVFCVIIIAGTLCTAKDYKIRGFVTSITSPTSFDIDDYRITRDNALSLEVEKDSDDGAAASFKPEDIRVGTELEIKGDYDESTGVLTAKSIKAFLDDTRKIRRTALIEKIPSLQRTDTGWIGTVAADGQRVSIISTTAVSYKLNQSERRQAKGAKDNREDATSLLSADLITLDTFMRYEGIRQPDGSILAKKVEFQHAELESGEAKMWRSLTPKVKDPNYSSFRPGEIRVEKLKYKLVPNKEAQDYIASFGENLVPQHQKDLSPDNPLKIPFRFYLVQDKSFNAAASPNGVVVVNSGVFDIAENEAQLAFILSHEISHAVEKHTWREHEYHKKALMALRIGGAIGAGFGGNGGRAISDMTTLVEAAVRNGYARSNENQADRVGLEWMLASGYDIREAPQSWKAVARKYGDRRTNLFWDDHDNNTTRRSYLMSEIKNNYSDVDFSSLKKDSEQFHHIAEAVTASEGRKTKIKLRVPKAGAKDTAAQKGKSTATAKTVDQNVGAMPPGTRAGQNDSARVVTPEPIPTERGKVIARTIPLPADADVQPASTTLQLARDSEPVRAEPPKTVSTDETAYKPLAVYPSAVDNSGQLSRWSNSTAPSGPETWWKLTPTDPVLKISLSSTSIFFPRQSVLTESPPTRIIIKSEDSSAVKLPALVISGTDAADFAETSTCLDTLEPEATCTVSVFFRPTGISTRTAILAIGASRKVTLTGIGN